MQKIRVGAIGCGYWGPNLIRNFVEIPGADLHAVADLDEERLAHIQSRYPQIQHVTQDYRDLFAMDLDAVVISTPPQTHFDITRDCITNGLHVLVEKPLSISVDEAQRMIELAEMHNRILMVGHTFEFNPAVTTLREMIQGGELGEIYYIDAVRASLGLFHPTLNVVWDLAPHDISILINLLGHMPERVATQGMACVQDSVEDVAYLTLMFPQNILTHIRLSWLDPHKTRRITVVGSEKMVVYDDVDNQEKIRVFDKRVQAIRRTDTFGEFQFAYHYGSIVSPYIHFEEPLRLECSHFLECIREEKQPTTDGYNGLRVVEVIEAAQRSLKNQGKPEAICMSRRPGLNGAKKAHQQSNGHHALTNSDHLLDFG